MKTTIIEYTDARVRLNKAFRKINYRINRYNEEDKEEYLRLKKFTMKQLRKMDKFLRKLITEKYINK